MKKTQTTAAIQNQLVQVIKRKDEAERQRKTLVAMLTDDFAKNEAAYRKGIVTESGILIVKPRWNFEAKPVVEVL